MRILKYVVRNQFKDFLPEPGDFEIVQEKVANIKEGEFLVKTEYISTDPYLRSFANKRSVPYDQFGFQVGRVIDSKNPKYPLNMNVVSHSGWRDYVILNGEPDEIFGIKPYEPHIGTLPLSLAIGALGMPGVTAYLGLLDICKPKSGEVVCVTSAAGAVGSLVGQIAKLKGCTVIGFAGSDAKVRYLREELGFHYAFNYKTVKDVKEAILSSTQGIDCFFDNVGGELTVKIMECMNRNGRVAVCGSISTYGNQGQVKVPPIPHGVSVESFSFTQWDPIQQSAALYQMRHWIERGAIKTKETICRGFDELPDTFIAMLKGAHIGKSVVKV